MDYDKLKAELTRDEGRRRKPYLDTVGKITIGVGWNLDDNGLPEDVIDILLTRSIEQAEFDARYLVPNFDELSDARQRVLVNMALNLGRARLAGFRNMLRCVNTSAFGVAADEMLASKWAQQVGDRAKRLAGMMRNG